VVDHERPDERRNTSEALMLGLRLAEGISREVEARAVALEPSRTQVFAQAIADGMLERAEDRLRFTERGMMLANETLEKLI
jgi:coproporphyrinogen III oxidase-like Fe-S oxidoreductase